MSWSAPPTFVAGTVFTAANANILSNDLAVLEKQIGLLGIGSAIINPGSLPGTTAPNFFVQAGAASVTPSSGVTTVTFPNQFPNGVIGAWAIDASTDATGVHCWVEINDITVAAVSLGFQNASGAVNSALIVAWLAIGF